MSKRKLQRFIIAFLVSFYFTTEEIYFGSAQNFQHHQALSLEVEYYTRSKPILTSISVICNWMSHINRAATQKYLNDKFSKIVAPRYTDSVLAVTCSLAHKERYRWLDRGRKKVLYRVNLSNLPPLKLPRGTQTSKSLEIEYLYLQNSFFIPAFHAR